MTFADWLTGQSPLIILMGFIIFGIIQAYFSEKKERKTKDSELKELSAKVIQVMALWEVRSKQNTDEHKDITAALNDLIKIVEKFKRDG